MVFDPRAPRPGEVGTNPLKRELLAFYAVQHRIVGMYADWIESVVPMKTDV